MKRILTMAAMAIGLSGAASAQDIMPKGSAGGWNVFLNGATNGCFIQRETEQGIFLQIGTEAALVELMPDDPIGFLSIWIPGEAPANSDPAELVLVEIGPNSYIGAAARGAREGYHGATVLAQGSELGFDLRNRRAMTITASNGAVVKVQLNASDVSSALDALADCQSEVS